MPTISETPHKVTTIIKRDGSKQPYDYEKVINAIRQAFKATRPLMEEDKLESDTLSVANGASVLIHGTAASDTRHTEEVQDIIEEVLMEFGAHDVAKAFILYREEHRNLRAGKIATDIVGTYLDKSDWRVQENSNSGYCYASLMNHAAGTVIANYCLENVYTRDVANAHIDGDIHLHDLSAGVVGYCAGHSLRDLLMKGFIGKYGRANAGPAKHLDTALLQAANFLCTLQTEWAGAQAFNSFDTFMAPFVRNDNLDYEQVKQRMQQFVFGLNIASRYGQCVPTTTKCLKADGSWVSYDKLSIGDKVLVYDINTRKVTTDTVTHKLIKPFNGCLHRYTSKNGYSFTITPDHRVVYFKDSVPYITESSNLIGTVVNISCSDFKHFNVKKHVECSITEEVYNDDVWCLTTNTGTFIAKDANSTVFLTGNCPFTNLTFDLSCPEDMKDQPVIIGGVLQDNTYGNYQKEMDMINKAFIEVMMNGDHDGRIFSFPIPTYNITKDFPWDSEVAKLLFKMTGKLGAPYFQNFISTGLNPRDVRSMALVPTQDLIYIRDDGRITRSQVAKMYDNWERVKPKYRMLMNGSFVEVTEMFKIPYTAGKYVEITLDNGYTQKFSMWHKCHVYRDGIFQTVESQDVLPTDKFVLSKQPWNVHNNVGTYNSGKILGYYLAEGWKNSHSNNEVEFAININRQDIVDEITTFFNSIGCVVFTDRQEDRHIFRIHVYGSQAVAFVSEYILGNKATEKHFSYTLWNTSDDFRRGVFEGYYITDGCPSDNAVAHTTNKELVLDLIVLGASIGEVFRYGVNNNNTRSFKEDKSDKVHFTSYRLRKYKCEEVDGFYLVPVSAVKQIPAKTEYVYNFTVNTPEHLFELPNGIISHQCCRLSLSLDDIRKHTGGLFGAGDQTGSIGVCTINIPRIAYLAAKTDDPKDTFYRLLDNRLNLCKKALEAKRREINKNFDNGLMPYTAEYLPKKFTRHFSTIGVIGFNEACRMLFNKTIADKECIDFTLEVMHYILDKCTKFTEETGNMYNFEAVPGESCLDIDTPIQTVSGSKTIRQILEEQARTGAKTPVLSYNTETNEVEVKEAFAFLSNESAKVMKITFDNGREVICNPKHPFGKRCFNGKNMYIDWVAAKDLKVGDRIKSNNMSKKVYKDGSFYWKINNHTTLHRLAAECKFGHKLSKDEVVHHLDGDKQNNNFDNIVLLSDEEHRRLHLEKNKQDRPEVYLVGSGDKNHFYGKHHSEETKKLISEKNKGKNTGDLNPARRPEVRAKLSEIAKNKPSERCSNYIADIDNDLIVNMYMSGKQPSVIAKELGGKYTYSVVKGRLKKLHVLEPNHIVTKIEYLDEERAIYNLEVEDNHNFFVGSMEDSVLTHNTSYRFAKIDKKKYPDIITAGTDDAPYYTNSSQLPVDYTSDPFEALELQEELQSTYSSGTVLHFFIGECIDDEEVVAKFVKSVCERSKIPYFSLTPEFSICPKCGYIRGIHETCPNHC